MNRKVLLMLVLGLFALAILPAAILVVTCSVASFRPEFEATRNFTGDVYFKPCDGGDPIDSPGYPT